MDGRKDLHLSVGKSKGKIHQQPWYKERLHTKYLKERGNKQQLSGALNGSRWRFLKNGMDDFRDGYPPLRGDDYFIPNQKGPRPVVHGEPVSLKQQPRKRFTKEQVCYSKQTPLQQARGEYIEEIEYGLTQHPLALYPHLEEGLPPELFEEVVDILDPEMHLSSEIGSCRADSAKEQEELSTDQQKTKDRALSTSKGELSTRPSASAISEDSKHKNPYMWLQDKEEAVKEDKKMKIKRLPSPSPDEDIKQITKEFCEWVASLGGESNNLDESTLMSLFGSGYESKPALTVPIQVVELTNVPAELRMAVGEFRPPTDTKSQFEKDGEIPMKSSYHPSWVKVKYGAWYLDPKTWKKRNADEPLKDPNDVREEKLDKMHKLSEKDEELMQLHGTHTFKEFILNKGVREPEFLKKIFSQEDENGKAEKDSKIGSRKDHNRAISTSTHAGTIVY